jgi:DNA-binding CsgD family transcriptional regulator
VVCTVTRELDVHHCIVTGYVDDRPRLTIDNIPDLDHETRRRYLAETWIHDPSLRELRRFHAPVAEHDFMHGLLLPILALGELIGSIRCRQPEPFDDRLRRDLTTLAGYATVHCARLGLGSTPDPLLDRLTARQREIAQLAARWRTYQEIGISLGITENTVKKHLKDVFFRLGISGRHELVPLVRHDSPWDADGCTDVGGITVTRAD